MLTGLKAGIFFPPQHTSAAEQALLHHHATDQSMKDQWRVQQSAQQAAMAAVNAIQQGGQGSYANFCSGYGWAKAGQGCMGSPWEVLKRSRSHAAGAAATSITRASATVRTDGSTCQGCGKPGHLQKMCRSKATTSSDSACKCCGDTGHAKADCPWKDETCEACGKKGHTIHVCRKANKTHRQWNCTHLRQRPHHSPRSSSPAEDGSPVNAAAPVAVAQGDAWWTYRCKECGLGIRDPDKIATICPHPSCKAKNRAKGGERKDDGTAVPTSALNLTFTKASIETERRIGTAGPGGDLPLPKQDQETVERVKQLEEEIAKLKDFEGTDFADQHRQTRERRCRNSKPSSRSRRPKKPGTDRRY